MTKKTKISQEDNDTWKNYIKDPNDIIDKDFVRKKSFINHQRYKFDLHGYTLAAANAKAKEVIMLCVKKKLNEILLITGKGIHSNIDKNTYVSKNFSKLKYSVPDYIQSNVEISKYILSITNAEKKDGGDGAIVIKLKNL